MSGRIIEKSISILPECMRTWIASLGPMEEILDIYIKNEVAVERVESWVNWKPITRRTITVFHKNNWYMKYFIFKDGVWYAVEKGVL